VKLSAKVEYACIAIVELARTYGTGEPVRIGRIGSDNGVPPKFLVQLLIQLKNAGFVVSSRGACGGYQLAKDPAEITLGDVCAAIDGQDRLESSATVGAPSVRVIMETWTDVAKRYRAMLDEITIADLADRAGQQSYSDYYI
jgi:Rrf2 family cysteine metabolism transcriptional repressor